MFRNRGKRKRKDQREREEGSIRNQLPLLGPNNREF